MLESVLSRRREHHFQEPVVPKMYRNEALKLEVDLEVDLGLFFCSLLS